MKVVFCGTPEFAVPSLQALVDAGHEVGLVLTQPDRPAGRKLAVQMPAVKVRALALGLSVMQPETIKSNVELRELLEAIAPDVIVVVAYGRIIPGWMLKLPRWGNINVHGSLLPKYRGAAPIQWAIAHGETETGVTTMRLDAGLDTGDTLLFRRISVGAEVTSAQVYPELAEVGAEVLLETLRGLEAGTLQAVAQDESRATLAPILTREDGRMLPQERTAKEAYDRWRGFMPWPGCWEMFRGKRFLVHALRVSDGTGEAGVLELVDGELRLGMKGGSAMVLDEVQMEGKPRMRGSEFARDFQVKAGERIG
jgi:methionyl-tRNA formyltransferase